MRGLRALAFVLVLVIAGPARSDGVTQEYLLQQWYGLVLKLVRHTATYSPPVASRNFAYLGVTSYEAIASGDSELTSLAGQLNGLKPLPRRMKGAAYDEEIILNAAMAKAMQDYFGNTGPSGQNALRATTRTLDTETRHGVAAAVVRRSKSYGEAIARHIFDWSQNDGGAVVTNMGFPAHYELSKKPGSWVPTNQLGMQQVPLLPDWGKNRPFAMPVGENCKVAEPPAYSEDKQSPFFQAANEVYQTRKSLSGDQTAIARFWSDDPMLSTTPPGHWVSILLQIADKEKLPAPRLADGLARLGVAVADAFIGCWQVKFQYDLIRPVTYIRKFIDPKFEPLLITPPFPEFPSGHSVQSGAAAAVLEKLFGSSYAFDDATYARDGIPARHFASFDAAAQEAALSRLYGGIHFRPAIQLGLEQGRCIGAYATALKTSKP